MDYYDDEDESLLVKNYRDGKLNGPSYFHYVSGELWIETNFKDGLEHGTLTYYEKDRTVIRTETWENGKCISTNTPEKTTKSGREEEKKSFHKLYRRTRPQRTMRQQPKRRPLAVVRDCDNLRNVSAEAPCPHELLGV